MTREPLGGRRILRTGFTGAMTLKTQAQIRGLAAQRRYGNAAMLYYNMLSGLRVAATRKISASLVQELNRPVYLCPLAIIRI
jgi:hypothetical protein